MPLSGVSHLAFCTHPALWLTSAHCIIIVLTFRSPSLECQLPGLVLPYKSLPQVGTSPGKCFASYLSHHTFHLFFYLLSFSPPTEIQDFWVQALYLFHTEMCPEHLGQYPVMCQFLVFDRWVTFPDWEWRGTGWGWGQESEKGLVHPGTRCWLGSSILYY